MLDALDAAAVRTAVAAARPDAIVYQATALADLSDFNHFDRSFAQTNRLRTEGADILIAAAREAGVRRIVAQSYADHRYAREGGPVKTEYDPLDPDPPAAMRQTIAAMDHLDRAVTNAGEIALAFAERWVGTARREVLDHLLIFGSRHLEYVLREFVEHYEDARPHQGLGQRTPRQREPTAISEAGSVERRDRLGGVLHEYARHAA